MLLKEKIKQKRTERRMSLSELARRSGHSVSTIHGIENGANSNPSFKTICDIADVLKIPLEQLKANKQ
jgi:transcriptional regulator with XRE-family HTH domain